MEDEECQENINNPLLMTGAGFTTWLSARGVDTVGIPPRSPILRATLLFELVSAGKMSPAEIEIYLTEIGLMVPIRET